MQHHTINSNEPAIMTEETHEKTIMIVDDNLVNLNAIELMLELMKF